MKQDNTDI